MIQSTKGIVLHRFKYSDSKMIAKIFTEEFGLQAYMIYGIGTKKGMMQINLIQPFALINLQVYHKDGGGIQKVKELSVDYPLNSISADIVKNTIVYFLAEFLLKTLKENEKDPELFKYIKECIIQLEITKDNVNNFHLIFLWKLSKYLGIEPENNYSESNKIFDLFAGKFIVGIPGHNNYLNENQSKVLFEILNTRTLDHHSLFLRVNERRFYLNSVLSFYNLHLDRPGELKSFKILSELFS